MSDAHSAAQHEPDAHASAAHGPVPSRPSSAVEILVGLLVVAAVLAAIGGLLGR
jgi:hypothetical protein